jgi:hypothetical protein
MTDRIVNSWTVGEYTIEEVPGFTPERPNLFRWTRQDEPTSGSVYRSNYHYRSLDMALAQAIAAKYMGEAGAMAPGVGTAADWFARMINMNDGE